MSDTLSRRSIMLGVPAAAVASAPLAAHASPAPPSAEYVEYRRAFDVWLALLNAEPDHSDPARGDWRVRSNQADDELTAALEALLKRAPQTWQDVSEVAIVAHDHAWNRHSQSYRGCDCPGDIVTGLILAVLSMNPGDATLHGRPPGWKSPLRWKLTIDN